MLSGIAVDVVAGTVVAMLAAALLHDVFEVVFGQKLPDGHSGFEVEPAGQYSPDTHATCVLAFAQ